MSYLHSREWHIIREFHTRRFDVVVDATYDDCPDMSFMTAEELQEFEDKGGACYLVRCQVFLDGAEVSSDYLGGCCYYDIDEFQDHRQCAAQTRKLRTEGSNAICGSYFADMISEGIKQARKHIAKLQTVRVRL